MLSTHVLIFRIVATWCAALWVLNKKKHSSEKRKMMAENETKTENQYNLISPSSLCRENMYNYSKRWNLNKMTFSDGFFLAAFFSPTYHWPEWIFIALANIVGGYESKWTLKNDSPWSPMLIESLFFFLLLLFEMFYLWSSAIEAYLCG